MKSLVTRSITGVIFVIVLCAAILSHCLSCAILFGFIAIIGCNEYYSIIKSKYVVNKTLPLILLSLIYIIMVFSNYPLSVIILPIIFLIITILYPSLYQLRDILIFISAAILIVIPFVLLVSLTHIEGKELSTSILDNKAFYNGEILLSFFVIMWTSDSLAYFFGSLLGKHKLAPKISPNKTWEGAISGLVFAIIAGFIISEYWLKETDALRIMIGAGFISILGLFGDLTESSFKRYFEVKDSGNLLPGHGGILDRFDGVLLSAPFVFLVYYY